MRQDLQIAEVVVYALRSLHSHRVDELQHQAIAEAHRRHRVAVAARQAIVEVATAAVAHIVVAALHTIVEDRHIAAVRVVAHHRMEVVALTAEAVAPTRVGETRVVDRSLTI